jgi:hypothetical protein
MSNSNSKILIIYLTYLCVNNLFRTVPGLIFKYIPYHANPILYSQEELIADISSAVSQALQQSPLLTASRAQLPPFVQAPGNDIFMTGHSYYFLSFLAALLNNILISL